MLGRTRRAIAGGLVLASAGVLAATALGAYSISSSPVRSLPMNTAGSINAGCPAGKNLTGGGFKATGPGGIAPLSHFPASTKKFTAGLKNTSIDSGDPEATIQSIAVCDGNDRYKIVAAAKLWNPGQTRTAEATCPRGMDVAGGGVKVPGQNFVVLQNRPKGKRVWRVEGYNGAIGQVQAVAYAVCDKDGGDYAIRKEDGESPPLRARGVGVAVTVQVRSQCESGERATGGGYAVTDTTVRPHASVPKAHLWRISFRTRTGAPADFTTYAVCKS